MDERRRVRVSKYLARHLRHEPARIGLTLDECGWAEVDALLAAAAAHGFRITPRELELVVAHDGKQRYTLENGRVRANQGHSVPVELGLPAAEPPAVLYHGTVSRHLAPIREQGLRPMSRHHVHLSGDRETATRVGARRGTPVVLVVDAAAMRAAGHTFRVSANGVWLADHVPPGFLRFPG
ncbi:putative RNA 2'-phosphotransferase [Sphaerisporangium melleum]|uniref:Probable RNA 2'-phosphotransferase n=1 Tax=Sphaerisporangium melleum TaxID=321316 RepID=A0A917RMC3_9ACTN|nr:RNA 2'-phosphotransferase [Sphaerisporangium melleum]GGL13764.1 putative RNA 2'-phosphotransferase [Sphaerisporangium melleum]GII74627.1 putative RNA 2'-phosphotransferase [Sphaerisporangium melleum]